MLDGLVVSGIVDPSRTPTGASVIITLADLSKMGYTLSDDVEVEVKSVEHRGADRLQLTLWASKYSTLYITPPGRSTGTIVR